MSHAVDSKSAAVHLIDPMLEPEPSAVDGPGSHFGNTMAAHQPNAPAPLPSKNPYRTPPRSPPAAATTTTDTTRTPTGKENASVRVRATSNASPSYRSQAFGDMEPRRTRSGSHGTPPSYQEAVSSGSGSGSQSRSGGGGGHHRRSSSLKERFPGDRSGEPLAMLRRDSRKAYRSPHLSKRQLAGTDMIDRLDPAIGGRAYHHEGPYDAALSGRNSDRKYSPIAALEGSNAEAIKATPPENVRDAVERHRPLDGTAIVPPGEFDRFGRRYDYEEGPDVQHEGAGGFAFDGEHLKGDDDGISTLDRALRAHNIDENGIEMEDRGGRNGKNATEAREAVVLQDEPATARAHDNDAGVGRSGSIKDSLKKRIGSLRHRKHDD